MRGAPDFLLNPEELRARKEKRRLRLAWAAGIVVLLIAAMLAARPSAHAIKAWQARRHAEKAFAFIAAEKWVDAQKEATAAYRLAPNEPEAIRAVARFLSRVHQPQALGFWDKLAKRRALTREDLRDEAGVALALGETGRASAALQSLLANNGREASTADWLLEAQLSAEGGAPNESMSSLEKVFRAAAASSQQQLQASVLELRIGSSAQDQKAKADAWARIEKLAKGKDAAGLDALVLLAQRELTGGTTAVSSPSTNTDATRKAGGADAEAGLSKPIPPSAIADAIASHPLAQTPQKLLAIDLRIAASPNEKRTLVQSAIDRWKNADDSALLALTKWLNGRGEFVRELETVPLARALRSRDLFLQRLDALGALGRWDEIRQLLESERYPLDPTIEHMYLARCDAQLGRQAGSENNWERALESAGGDAQKLMTLAEYAEKNGAASVAMRACDAAIAAAPELRPAWQEKLRIAQAARDTASIHAVLAGMLKLWPNDTAIENDEAYLRLLLAGARKAETLKTEKLKPEDGGQRSSPPPITSNNELITIAKRLVQREPTSLPHRTLLALVLLKEGRPYTALDVYRDLNVPMSALTPSALAVHAAVLAATGNGQGAQEEAEKIPRDQLLPEERALIAGL